MNKTDKFSSIQGTEWVVHYSDGCTFTGEALDVGKERLVMRWETATEPIDMILDWDKMDRVKVPGFLWGTGESLRAQIKKMGFWDK